MTKKMMTTTATNFKHKAVFAIIFLFILSLLSTVVPIGVPGAEASRLQPFSNLKIGDRVMDPSWTWTYQNGNNNGGGGTKKPVVWRVVGKNGFDGLDSHLTLVTTDLIGVRPFDTTRGAGYGSNHWGNSTLRAWLNSDFYNSMTASFRHGIFTTSLENKLWQSGNVYTTTDKVFLFSQSELGGGDYMTHKIGNNLGYFYNDRRRIATVGGRIYNYWTRSPASNSERQVRCVGQGGNFSYRDADFFNVGVRPVINFDAEFPVSITQRSDGIYEMAYVEPDHVVETAASGETKEKDPYVQSPAAGSQMMPMMITGLMLFLFGLMLLAPLKPARMAAAVAGSAGSAGSDSAVRGPVLNSGLLRRSDVFDTGSERDDSGTAGRSVSQKARDIMLATGALAPSAPPEVNVPSAKPVTEDRMGHEDGQPVLEGLVGGKSASQGDLVPKKTKKRIVITKKKTANSNNNRKNSVAPLLITSATVTLLSLFLLKDSKNKENE